MSDQEKKYQTHTGQFLTVWKTQENWVPLSFFFPFFFTFSSLLRRCMKQLVWHTGANKRATDRYRTSIRANHVSTVQGGKKAGSHLSPLAQGQMDSITMETKGGLSSISIFCPSVLISHTVTRTNGEMRTFIWFSIEWVGVRKKQFFRFI